MLVSVSQKYYLLIQIKVRENKRWHSMICSLIGRQVKNKKMLSPIIKK